MFDAVLVANRGEIALRVLRGCRDLGVRGVAVYSTADRDAPWLAHADDAFRLGPAPAAQSYLDIERVVAVAGDAGVDAVHPGYGFLAESADFARAVGEAGLAWIGPPPAAIEAMGDKLSARAHASAAGCPVVPGTMEPTDDPTVARDFAARHGLPVAIKAAFGGGGRGMKVVRREADLDDALEAAQRESVAAFGRGEVYVERYLARPRHVEIQVLADAHGRVIHLGERDCSTQRRHQKLIEEAPAPGLDETSRAAMGEAAVRVAREVGYVGAGTCEFLYEPDSGDFFFLEMNTRLQVEHPVTELVTGVDLVHEQLRIAAGQPLRLDQNDVGLRGHAIEARINAEDTRKGFAPAPGRITAWRPPQGPGVRVDAGAAAGWEIPRDYDSLVAKLICYAGTRNEAITVLRRALAEFVVEGVPTTIDFHRLASAHPDFLAGRVSTVSVETEWDLSDVAPAVAPVEGGGPSEPSRTVTVEVGGKRLEVALFEPAEQQAAARPRRGRAVSSGAAAVAEEVLTAPMQGTIIKTAVTQGETVSAGDLVAVLEAMKMENQVAAHRDGVVAALHVAAGDTVTPGSPLVTIEDA